jgi:hypothetical protein
MQSVGISGPTLRTYFLVYLMCKSFTTGNFTLQGRCVYTELDVESLVNMDCDAESRNV